MYIGIPQLIYVFLILLNVGIAIIKFGQEKDETYNWVDILISPAISFGLLYWGGFFG